MRLRVTFRSATRTALICDPINTSTSSKAMASAARCATCSIGPPASYIESSISRPRMPPRLLISETASRTLLVEAGPQIPGEPEKVRKLPTHNLFCAPPRLEPVSIGRREGRGVVADRFLNNCLLYTSPSPRDGL